MDKSGRCREDPTQDCATGGQAVEVGDGCCPRAQACRAAWRGPQSFPVGVCSSTAGPSSPVPGIPLVSHELAEGPVGPNTVRPSAHACFARPSGENVGGGLVVRTSALTLTSPTSQVVKPTGRPGHQPGPQRGVQEPCLNFRACAHSCGAAAFLAGARSPSFPSVSGDCVSASAAPPLVRRPLPHQDGLATIPFVLLPQDLLSCLQTGPSLGIFSPLHSYFSLFKTELPGQVLCVYCLSSTNCLLLILRGPCPLSP